MELRKSIKPEGLDLIEKLIEVRRVNKVVKGGKRMRFRALVVVGDGKGHVGMGMGKAKDVAEAIRKGGVRARKHLLRVPLAGTTIPYETTAKFGAAKVLLKPAAPGTGVIAGGPVRAVLEAVGVKDILTKSLGASNAATQIQATLRALSQLKDIHSWLAERQTGVAVSG